jgi:hypothetical protein
MLMLMIQVDQVDVKEIEGWITAFVFAVVAAALIVIGAFIWFAWAMVCYGC